MRTRLILGSLLALFFLLGAALVPYAGVEEDEALFATPFFFHISNDLYIMAFHRSIPLMVLSYVGALKTLLYLPIFAAFGISVWSVRLPMVLAGVLTIWIFFHLARLAAGRSVALLAAALLATDPSFLLTDTFDWGPVALQHLLLVTGCFFLLRFGQAKDANSGRDLALGFFCWGLAMWDKAIFLWAFAGLAAGGLAVFWPEVRRAFQRRNVTLAAGAFVLGALPLVIFNLRHPNVTLGSNAHLELPNLQRKVRALTNTLNGALLLGFLPSEEWAEKPKAPASRRGRVAQWIRTHLGKHREDGLVYAFGLSLLAAPFWWRSRAARFSLVFLGVAWASMLFTKGAGDSAHHTILLWPFPHLFIAAALAAACGGSSKTPLTNVRGSVDLRYRAATKGSGLWRRAILPAAGIVLAAMNLLVVNQYIYQFECDGAAGNFTDALFPLSDAFRDPIPGQPEQPIYVMDWGMLNTLELFHRGHLLLRVGLDPFITDTPDAYGQGLIKYELDDPNALFVGHLPGREVVPGVDGRLSRAAADAGRQKEIIRTIPDSNGRPVFEIFRFRK